MEEKKQRLRIPNEKRQECLKLFEDGCGYKMTARLAGLNTYTVRDYRRRFLSGDVSWAERGPLPVYSSGPDGNSHVST